MVPLLVCSAMSLLFLICISGFKPRLCLTLLVHIPSEPDIFMTIFYPMSCFVTQWAQINLITISEFKLSKQLGAYNVINLGFHRVYKLWRETHNWTENHHNFVLKQDNSFLVHKVWIGWRMFISSLERAAAISGVLTNLTCVSLPLLAGLVLSQCRSEHHLWHPRILRFLILTGTRRAHSMY